MPIRVYGLNYPIYLDRDGEYFDNGRLYDIIKESTDNKAKVKMGTAIAITSTGLDEEPVASVGLSVLF
jgi:hypothetical protein